MVETSRHELTLADPTSNQTTILILNISLSNKKFPNLTLFPNEIPISEYVLKR